jgi:hypothetical protein
MSMQYWSKCSVRLPAISEIMRAAENSATPPWGGQKWASLVPNRIDTDPDYDRFFGESAPDSNHRQFDLYADTWSFRLANSLV